MEVFIVSDQFRTFEDRRERMAATLAAVVLVCVLATTPSTCRAGITEALYHSSVNFSCNSVPGSDVDLSRYSSAEVERLWILPNDDLIVPGTTNGHERVQVLEGGAVLQVLEVEDEDFGWYYCLIHVVPLDSFLLRKSGLNVHGPYWGDLYDLKYKGMVTTGLVAGAVCFVVTGVLCFLYGRQQSRLEKQAEEERDRDPEMAKATGGHINPAFQGQDSPDAAVPINDGDTPAGKKGPAPGPPAMQQGSPTAGTAASSADGDTRL